MSALPTLRAGELDVQPEEQRWLVEDLWGEQAVGIIGGEPKCCKSFLALDMALAVAAGTRCLRRFAVQNPGPVLLFPAEDSLPVVRRRLEGIAAAANVKLGRLDLHVITSPTLRLDVTTDRERLAATVEAIRPRLLVMDPFVRLHRVDENASGEVAPLLAFLRELQRKHRLAVVVVHHARKNGSRARPGQALRGSSELHAWGDSNLYLRRRADQLLLCVEHRAAAGRDDVALALRGDDDALALELVDDASPAESVRQATPAERVRAALADANGPLALPDLRAASALRKSTLCRVLTEMQRAGLVHRDHSGYLLADAS